MKKADIIAILEEFKKANPAPECELDFVNGYTFLVAIILSAQATDKGVNKATPVLFSKVRSPQEMIDLGSDGLKEYIKTIGLYNNKAKSILNMSASLVEKFGGEVPKTQKELESLAGVGRKTANVYLNSMYRAPLIGVDTHVSRVSQRLGWSKSDKPLQIEKDLDKLISDEYKIYLGHWLVLHGRYVCKAKKPDCEHCSIAKYCPFLKKQQNG